MLYIFLLVTSLLCTIKGKRNNKKILFWVGLTSVIFCLCEALLMAFSLQYSPVIKYPVYFVLILSMYISYFYTCNKILWIKIIAAYVIVVLSFVYYWLTPAVIISEDYVGVYDKSTATCPTEVVYYKNYYIFADLKYSYIDDYGIVFGDWKDIIKNYTPYSRKYN